MDTQIFDISQRSVHRMPSVRTTLLDDSVSNRSSQGKLSNATVSLIEYHEAQPAGRATRLLSTVDSWMLATDLDQVSDLDSENTLDLCSSSESSSSTGLTSATSFSLLQEDVSSNVAGSPNGFEFTVIRTVVAPPSPPLIGCLPLSRPSSPISLSFSPISRPSSPFPLPISPSAFSESFPFLPEPRGWFSGPTSPVSRLFEGSPVLRTSLGRGIQEMHDRYELGLKLSSLEVWITTTIEITTQ